MEPSSIEILATALFGFAILHTFSAARFQKLAHRYPEGSVGENGFHLLGEVEVVFGLWATVMLIGMTFMLGSTSMIDYVESSFILEGTSKPIQVNFTEPMFVFVIMAMSATRPVLQITARVIEKVSSIIPLPESVSFYIAALIVGPLLGSFITEPAAMTVTALILKRRYYDKGISKRLMYATLGVLFVNVSIGGTLTNFAAPPVLMVAAKWEWSSTFMFVHIGWKAAIAVFINTLVLSWLFRRELREMGDVAADLQAPEPAKKRGAPWWLVLLHLALMGAVVVTAHHMAVFFIIFLLFLGICEVTHEYQDELKLKEALLVGYFLMGLVILGGLQRWWLEPVIGSLDELPLFIGSAGLTAITDNAALTYLGSLVEDISEPSKLALVMGAVAGGGLTVIANAPNPAGFGILKDSFGHDGISPAKLLTSSLGPTVVGMLCLWLLPSLPYTPPEKPDKPAAVEESGDHGSLVPPDDPLITVATRE